MRDEPGEDPAVQRTPSNVVKATLISLVMVIVVVVAFVTWAIRELLNLAADRDFVTSGADPAVLLLPFSQVVFHVWESGVLKEDLRLPKLSDLGISLSDLRAESKLACTSATSNLA